MSITPDISAEMWLGASGWAFGQPGVEGDDAGLGAEAHDGGQGDECLDAGPGGAQRRGIGQAAVRGQQQQRHPDAGAAEVRDGQVLVDRAPGGGFVAGDEDRARGQQGHEFPEGQQGEDGARGEDAREGEDEGGRQRADRGGVAHAGQVAERSTRVPGTPVTASVTRKKPVSGSMPRPTPAPFDERRSDARGAEEDERSGRAQGQLCRPPGRPSRSRAGFDVPTARRRPRPPRRRRARAGSGGLTLSTRLLRSAGGGRLREREFVQQCLGLGQVGQDDTAGHFQQLEDQRGRGRRSARWCPPWSPRPGPVDAGRRGAATRCSNRCRSSSRSSPTVRSPSRSSSSMRTRTGCPSTRKNSALTAWMGVVESRSAPRW